MMISECMNDVPVWRRQIDVFMASNLLKKKIQRIVNIDHLPFTFTQSIL